MAHLVVKLSNIMYWAIVYSVHVRPSHELFIFLFCFAHFVNTDMHIHFNLKVPWSYSYCNRFIFIDTHYYSNDIKGFVLLRSNCGTNTFTPKLFKVCYLFV